MWMSTCCCGKGSLRTGCKIISAVELLLGGITLILGCIYANGRDTAKTALGEILRKILYLWTASLL